MSLISSTPTLRKRTRVLTTLVALAALALGVTAGCSSSPTYSNNAEPSGTQSSGTTTSQSQHYDDDDQDDKGDLEEEDTANDGPNTTVNQSDWVTSSSYTPTEMPATQPIVTDLRVGQHKGYDRVVIDLTGEGPVGWEARYVDVVNSQGKGDPVDIPGTKFLQLVLVGTTIPVTDQELDDYYDDNDIESGQVINAVYDSTFEGRSQFVIGTDKERPFHIFWLTDPLRVVIDISAE
ncbi:AMIN-like domain-containing (lipo)protein [Actinomyces minihominis]|uniref:AMIN-like domain-containing (lipo)protein n=1 Tax=Actinomyces minihominis TaxID=2002838 RepID=UPI000C07077A|nr:hypothetical protein [Actinomyces minihominis]